jgi:hypothetical protein
MCKIGLISWPINSKSPRNFYINLGEIYDKDVKDNLSILSEFNRYLRYLYPFRYSISENKCYNSEDFKTFKSKYSLTVGYKLVGEIPSENVIVFRTPILYDITCMIPVFEKVLIQPLSSPELSLSSPEMSVYIVIPTLDPICRGKILDEVISNNPKYIILTGSVSGSNSSSTITLMTRYLSRRKIPMDIIIKSKGDKKPTCILDCLALIDIMDLNTLNIVVACSCSDITDLQKAVRVWRRLKVINKRISYYCPFY